MFPTVHSSLRSLLEGQRFCMINGYGEQNGSILSWVWIVSCFRNSDENILLALLYIILYDTLAFHYNIVWRLILCRQGIPGLSAVLGNSTLFCNALQCDYIIVWWSWSVHWTDWFGTWCGSWKCGNVISCHQEINATPQLLSCCIFLIDLSTGKAILRHLRQTVLKKSDLNNVLLTGIVWVVFKDDLLRWIFFSSMSVPIFLYLLSKCYEWSHDSTWIHTVLMLSNLIHNLAIPISVPVISLYCTTDNPFKGRISISPVKWWL